MARGNGEHTNWCTRTRKLWKLSWLTSGNISLPIICYLSRLALFLVFIMRGMCSRGQVGHWEGPFIPGLQSAKTPRDSERAGREGRREMCGANLFPSRFSLSRFNFLCVPEMLERWMLQFVHCSLHVQRESLSVLSRSSGCTISMFLNQDCEECFVVSSYGVFFD